MIIPELSKLEAVILDLLTVSLSLVAVIGSWVVGRMGLRRSSALVASLLVLVALLRELPFLLTLTAENQSEALMILSMLMRRSVAFITLILPAVPAFLLGQFQRKGRPRLVATAVMWLLLCVEAVACWITLERRGDSEALWYFVVVMAVTVAAGGLTIFAQPAGAEGPKGVGGAPSGRRGDPGERGSQV